MNGGERVAGVLASHGVQFLFTLCGGHISPILVGAKQRGIRVVDVRDEASAVFAADAVSRLSGVPGVAAVTAGPGLTNAITAVKNAQLAQSPVVLLGGATATMLKGRGALQDIDQRALLHPHVKFLATVRRVRDLAPAVAAAFHAAQAGVPGPAFVECPVDLLYPEATVRDWYGLATPKPPRGMGERLSRWYLRRHVERLFAGADRAAVNLAPSRPAEPAPGARRRTADLLARSERPVLLLGSQAAAPQHVDRVRGAVESLGCPVYLSGMARGLLGRHHPLLFRHRRGLALREADLVLLAGVPCDFRLDYGRSINPRAAVVAANLSPAEARRNRRPAVAAIGDPARFVISLAPLLAAGGSARWATWLETLRARDDERAAEIERLAASATEYVNPLALCRAIEAVLPEDSAIVADGGDFVGTAAYIVSPRGPRSWLDPGPFGTLGVGAGFALGAALCRPRAEVWLLYGDGSAAFSLAEFDTFVRHGLPVIAVVGNDGAWSQIARGQVDMLHDDVGTVLRRTEYQLVAEGYGGRGLKITRPEEVAPTLREAQAIARSGRPVLVNALIGKTDFRAGSISI
jgi:acetolactate synthase-1/2/3 large subunit